jgi:pimeloyl-ACP methyl ester carboxylesterase
MRIDHHNAFAATGGRPFDPALPAVVFIHGSGLDHSVWALHSRWFAFHGRSVLAVDLPGHGHSDGAPLPTIAAMADWVAALIAEAGLTQAAVVGHSMGSLVALETAARHPERVRALGLVAAAAAIPVHPDLLAAGRANDHAAIDMVAIWGHGQRAGLGGSQAPGLWMLGGAIRVLERAKPGVLGSDLAACDAYRDGVAAAARIKAPTVLVLGGRDQMTPLKAGRALAESIAGSRSVILPDAGHMLMAERPDEVLEALAGTV